MFIFISSNIKHIRKTLDNIFLLLKQVHKEESDFLKKK
jgi:hypothetical protein